MAHISGNDVKKIKSEGEIHESGWSNEHDSVPLQVRMKTLFATTLPLHLGASVSHSETIVKKKDDHCDSEGAFCFHSASFGAEKKDEWLSQDQGHGSQVLQVVTSEIPEFKISVDSGASDLCSQNVTSNQCVGIAEDFYNQGTQINTSFHPNHIISTEVSANILGPEEVNANVCTLSQDRTLPNLTVKVRVEYSDDDLMSPLGCDINSSIQTDMQGVKVEDEIPHAFAADDLDHIVLKERQKMLLPRELVGLAKPVLEGGSRGLSNPVMEDLIQDCAGKGKTGLLRHCLQLASSWQETESTKSSCSMEIHENDMICSSGKISPGCKSCGILDAVPANSDSMTSSTSSTFLKVKAEPSDMDDLHCPDMNAVDNTLPVKSELQTDDESCGDELDHMSLRDRIKLLVPEEASDLSISRKYKCLRKIEHSFVDYCSIVTECSKPISINRPRKRKRSATDSIQTALDEDAPGLLQVLIDKGVLVDEIRLYGGVESDDALDDSLNENNFSELEAVMSKLFSQRQSVLKFTPIRCKKGSKVSYCLPCLLSLVEQTRYLRFRKWPVEWGWCRDLQAFIFVFERHNRIVLERPEYGYATYFFELVDSLPINWQIKRLVVAMKLTSCSRITLIENKALLVGEDLTEGEARVLTEYGWIPNSGLATMLNYCDRVVHDKQNEREVSEWRSKIGKLLMAGYNGGIIISTNTPKRVTE